MEFYLQAFQLSLCLGTMCLGIFITMKIFNIPDITTDGSYTLGATITAILITHHFPLLLVLIASMIMGSIAGTLTGLIHTQLKIDALLAGILVMTGLYSVNLIILGRSNIPLIDTASIFNFLHIFQNETYNNLIVGLVFCVGAILILTFVLKTDFGIAMRATGSSETMTKALGINNNRMKIIGLAIANALTALSGFLVTQYQGFADINMGIGIVIVGLGSVLIASSLKNWLKIKTIGAQLLLVILGSFIFQMVLALTLASGVDPNLLKLVTALFVLFIVGIPRISNFIKKNK
jgi:putative tryptophan/tyrosine transport system permease protein